MIEFIHHSKNKKNLIIFIHGFIGGKETWMKKDESMPLIDYLLEENEIKNNFNIALFEYHSELFKFFPKINNLFKMLQKKKSSKNLAINDLSKQLESLIKYSCAEYENIILIGHSMGGLVAKRFILDDLKKNTDSKVKLYVSLATPHSGSIIANFGSNLIKNVQTKDLSVLSESINQMNNEWIQNKNLPKRIYGQGLSDQIVQKESSIAYDSDNQEIIYSDDDHFSIIVPKSKNVIIDALNTELKHFLKEQKINAIQNNIDFTDSGQYDEDIFVLKLLMANIHTTLVKNSKKAFYEVEFVTRKLHSLGVDMNELKPLYEKIQQIYIIEFGKFLGGNHNNSDALLTAVYDTIIVEDKKRLKSLHSPLQSLHKYGMIHQLSDKDENNIWWAKEHDIKTLEEFKNTFNNN